MKFLNIFNRKKTCYSELVSESMVKKTLNKFQGDNSCGMLFAQTKCHSELVSESQANVRCFADAQHDVKCLNKKVAFTLAEVLITLTILGVVAALTIPSVMRTQNEAAERTKLKKAIVDYEKLISNMTIENNLTSIEALKDYANKDNCVKSRTYFKIKQDDTSLSPNNCIFQTSNGVWWNVTDITRPIISTKGVENLSTADGENSFLLSTTYSDTARAFVVNDLNTLSEPDKSNVQKTLAVAKIINKGANDGVLSDADKISAWASLQNNTNPDTYVCNGNNESCCDRESGNLYGNGGVVIGNCNLDEDEGRVQGWYGDITMSDGSDIRIGVWDNYHKYCSATDGIAKEKCLSEYGDNLSAPCLLGGYTICDTEFNAEYNMENCSLDPNGTMYYNGNRYAEDSCHY